MGIDFLRSTASCPAGLIGRFLQKIALCGTRCLNLVLRNIWSLPGCQSLFLTSFGSVVMQGAPLVTGTVDVPTFDKEALIKALRIDQAGESTFPEFFAASWRAGVVRYDVDFAARTVAYLGCNGEEYIEGYPAVDIS